VQPVGGKLALGQTCTGGTGGEEILRGEVAEARPVEIAGFSDPVIERRSQRCPRKVSLFWAYGYVERCGMRNRPCYTGDHHWHRCRGIWRRNPAASVFAQKDQRIDRKRALRGNPRRHQTQQGHRHHHTGQDQWVAGRCLVDDVGEHASGEKSKGQSRH
jgi:hypothetical protein